MVGGALPLAFTTQDQRPASLHEPTFTLRFRSRVSFDASVPRSGSSHPGACAGGDHTFTVAASRLDDHHLPLLDPLDRAAAIRAACNAGDAVWARAACLGIARDLCAEARDLLTTGVRSPSDLARACIALVDAAHWRALARTCGLTLAVLREVA